MAAKSALVLFLISIFMALPALARQVVTDKDRQWARQVIAQEKELAGSFAEDTIGVLYFQNATGDKDLDPLQKGLAIMLISDLSSLEGYQVVERPRLQALLEELKLHASGLVDPQTMVRLRRLLQANWLIGGDFTGSRDLLRIQGRKVDLKHETPEGLKAVEGAMRELFKLEKALLAQIINSLALKVSDQERERLLAVPPIDYRAMWYFFKGVQASDRQDYRQAAQMYERALKMDPKCQSAKLALDELFSLRLVRPVDTRKGFLKTMKGATTLTDTLTPKYPVKRLRRPGAIPVEKKPLPTPSPGSGGSSGSTSPGGGSTYPYGPFTTGP